MPELKLTQFRYATECRGPLKIYVYEADGFHRGGIWFENSPRYRDEEITTANAEWLFREAMRKGREIRITNGADELVAHANNGVLLFPNSTVDELWARLKGVLNAR